MVINLPEIQKTQEKQVPFMGQGDLLEEGMATHSSNLAWKIPWTEESGRVKSLGPHKELDTTEAIAHTHALLHPNMGTSLVAQIVKNLSAIQETQA